MSAEPAGPRRQMSGLLAAWVLTLGVDLFLHAGLLAPLYAAAESPFLLPPAEAFRRIPLGYLGFFILTASLQWLIRRLEVRKATSGFRLGLAAGVSVWGALVLGLASVTTAPMLLLVGWWVGQSVELALAGAVLAVVEAGAGLRRVWVFVAVAVLGLFAITVVLQSLGLAPPMARA